MLVQKIKIPRLIPKRGFCKKILLCLIASIVILERMKIQTITPARF